MQSEGPPQAGALRLGRAPHDHHELFSSGHPHAHLRGLLRGFVYLKRFRMSGACRSQPIQSVTHIIMLCILGCMLPCGDPRSQDFTRVRSNLSSVRFLLSGPQGQCYVVCAGVFCSHKPPYCSMGSLAIPRASMNNILT